uniref:Uncharacterized protein n=1 Tax=Daphnia magna TaxID=35525 RepID=A0A0P5VU42_9CRUS
MCCVYKKREKKSQFQHVHSIPPKSRVGKERFQDEEQNVYVLMATKKMCRHSEGGYTQPNVMRSRWTQETSSKRPPSVTNTPCTVSLSFSLWP